MRRVACLKERYCARGRPAAMAEMDTCLFQLHDQEKRQGREGVSEKGHRWCMMQSLNQMRFEGEA